MTHDVEINAQHISRQFKKPGIFVQLATKCIDYCVVWSGWGISYYNCVAKPNDS